MRMLISRIPARQVRLLHQSQVLSAVERPWMSLFEPERIVERAQADAGLPDRARCAPSVRSSPGPPDEGRWVGPETYYRLNGPADVRVSHGICPNCLSSTSAETGRWRFLSRGSAAPIPDHGAGLRRRRVARPDADGYLRALAPREITGGHAGVASAAVGFRSSIPDDAEGVRAALGEASARPLRRHHVSGPGARRIPPVPGLRHAHSRSWRRGRSPAWPDLRPRCTVRANGMRGRAPNRLIGPSSRPRPRWSGVGATRTDSPKARAGPSRRHSAGASGWSSSIPTTVNALRSPWDEALAKGSASFLEYRARTDQGVYRWCQSPGRPGAQPGRGDPRAGRFAHRHPRGKAGARRAA